MLSVEPQPSSLSEGPSFEIEPPITQEVEELALKQVLKPKKLFTPLNITIIVALIAIAGFGTFYLLNTEKEIDIKSSISQSHGKIIENAGSSNKDGSNSGSSSSKSSTTNNKPHSPSLPASKGVISSNPGIIGKGSDEPDPNDDEDNGDKRKKKLNGSTSGGSTDEDSEEEEEEEDDENAEEGVYWVDTKLEGSNASPLVGGARP